MPRTETCKVCGGDGSRNGETCLECGGNGYAPAPEPTLAQKVEAIFRAPDETTDLDFTLTPAPAPVNRMANATWRILEEQRATALETAADLDAQITALQAKRDDALRAAAMCAAGQTAGETP